MAKVVSPIYLGFEDGVITEKYKSQVDFTTNKIGGTPNSPKDINLQPQHCPLCNALQPLVVQIYAPLENQTNHRNFYVFACINQSCWNQNKSWSCIRVESPFEQEINNDNNHQTELSERHNSQDWCTSADEWGDTDSDIMDDFSDIGSNKNDLINKIENLDISNATPNKFENVDEMECASEIIKDTNNEKSQNLQFISYFITVTTEIENTETNLDKHVDELLSKYNQSLENTNIDVVSNESDNNKSVNFVVENYENGVPVHGDKMFHRFLKKIQNNPGQILRYGRDTSPLLLQPLEPPKHCEYCNSEMIFEFQILPTLISKLKLTPEHGPRDSTLEFGTVIIFTCKKSCWSSNKDIKYESVIVQKEI